MAFSIRNIFGSNPDDPTPSDTSHSQENPVAAPVPNAGFLFKTAANSGGAALDTTPQKSSVTAGASALVLADVIPSIPQEMRHPTFQNLQAPVTLPTSVLREHLGRGKAALPLVEIYRALPEAFAQPVDDQDPRSVAVPPVKLVALIAQLKTAGASPQDGTSGGFLPKASLSGGHQASESGGSAPQVTSSFSHLPPPHRSESNPFNTLPRRRVEPSAEVSAPETEEKSSPFSKVERPAAKSPFAPVAPSEAPPINKVPPAAASLPSSEPSTPRPQASESAPEEKPLAMPSPFTAVKAFSPTPPEAAQIAQQVAATAPPAASPFERVKALTSRPRAESESQDASEEPTIGLELKQLLKLVSAQDLGFDAQSLPSDMQAKIPVSVLRSKLHQPAPSLSLGELSQYVRSDVGALLQSGNASTQVELPMNQLYHQLAQQENTINTAAKMVTQATSEPEPSSALEAFPSLPELEQRLIPETPVPQAAIETMPVFEPAPEIAVPSPLNEPAAVPATPEPTSSLLSQWVTQAPPAAPVAPAVAEPASFPEASSSAPVLAPVTTAMIAPPDALDFAQSRTISKSRGDQLIWRVLFGVKQEVDAEGVLELTRQQLGVPAVAVIQGGSVTLQKVEASEAAKQFLAQAPKICEHLQPLVQLTGIQDAETFSIKHHDYVNTFSAQGRYTLAVMHSPVADETALKEKITLIARELNALLGA